MLKDDVDYLIIDEACQAIEPATIIPMQMNATRVILVGDHRQLPATVFSRDSVATGFCRSLFERFADSDVSTFMLSTQYRMHPEISAFPSKEFYGNKLKDHSSVFDRTIPDHLVEFNSNMIARRLLFIDLPSSKEHIDSTLSKSNRLEVAATIGLTGLMGDALNHDSVGVITPYKSQRVALSRVLNANVEVNTVDSF